jgi:hypothetical protein
MSIRTVLLALPLIFVALASFAKEPPLVHKCILNPCLSTYYMCDPSTVKTCSPSLTRAQKESLEAYHLCQDLGHKTCEHPGISDILMTKLNTVTSNFNQCKLTCYKQHAPKLYKAVFKAS